MTFTSTSKLRRGEDKLIFLPPPSPCNTIAECPGGFYPVPPFLVPAANGLGATLLAGDGRRGFAGAVCAFLPATCPSVHIPGAVFGLALLERSRLEFPNAGSLFISRSASPLCVRSSERPPIRCRFFQTAPRLRRYCPLDDLFRYHDKNLCRPSPSLPDFHFEIFAL